MCLFPNKYILQFFCSCCSFCIHQCLRKFICNCSERSWTEKWRWKKSLRFAIFHIYFLSLFLTFRVVFDCIERLKCQQWKPKEKIKLSENILITKIIVIVIIIISSSCFYGYDDGIFHFIFFVTILCSFFALFWEWSGFGCSSFSFLSLCLSWFHASA